MSDRPSEDCSGCLGARRICEAHHSTRGRMTSAWDRASHARAATRLSRHRCQRRGGMSDEERRAVRVVLRLHEK
jgi:hypothetical protein